MTLTEPRQLAEKQAIIDTVNAIGMEADRHEWQACRAGFAEVHNLQGGMAAWADQVAPAMARY